MLQCDMNAGPNGSARIIWRSPLREPERGTFTVESFAEVSDKTPNYTASCKRD